MFQNYRDLTVGDINEFLTGYKNESNLLIDNLVTLDDLVLSWDTFIEPQLDFEVKVAPRYQIILMDEFHTSEEIRKACNDTSTDIQKFEIDQNMRKDLFAKFKYYFHNQFQNEKQILSPERIKFVEDSMKEYKMNGLDLDDEQFEMVKEIKKELTELSNKFSFNLSSETTSLEFSLDQLSGLPESWLQSRLQENGLYKVTLKIPDYLPVMEQCSVRDTRKTMSIAFNSRCTAENEPICKRVFKLRHDLAEIFGFDSFANYSLQKKMVKTYDNAMNFLNDLASNIDKVLDSEYEQLYKIANLDGITKFELYDVGYYTRIFKENETSLDNESLRQYFGLETVTAGIFQIYQQFLSVKFTEITSEHVNEFWHESVQLFQVNDAITNELMGYFYLDLYPRDGKYGHFAVFPFIRKSLNTIPVCTMACNFTKEKGLTHNEVVTYFHEFGHVMHNMCSNVELLSFGGTSTARDYVELPSQCFENWCYALEPLKILSGGSITEEIVDKINKQSKLCQFYFNARQLTFGFVDMAVHSTRWDETPDEVYNSIIKHVLKLEPFDGMRFMETFSHIICGYESCYYGYLYSKVFSDDIYVTCVKGHELDPTVGLKYRKEILSFGGARNEMDGLVNMLGREPNSDAFVKSIFG